MKKKKTKPKTTRKNKSELEEIPNILDILS
jgi:hypothetical protein